MSRHTHNPVSDHAGRQICSICHQVIIKPILSSDDPRLVDAGLHRSGGRYEEQRYPPLPEMLIALYFNGPALGLPRAPKAPYIDCVAQEAGRRSKGLGNLDDVWTDLHRGWLENDQRKQDQK